MQVHTEQRHAFFVITGILNTEGLELTQQKVWYYLVHGGS